MAIPNIKSSKKEIIGMGDIAAAINLSTSTNADKSDIPKDCKFTCDKEYFVDYQGEFDQVLSTGDEPTESKKISRDYAIGAFLYLNKYPAGVLLIAPLLEENIETPTEILYGILNDDYYEINYDARNQTLQYNGHTWVYTTVKGTTHSDFTTYELRGSSDVEEIQNFLSDIHAEVRN